MNNEMPGRLQIKIDESLVLKLIDENFAESIFRLVDSNRLYLGRWLPWVELSSNVNYTREYIRSSLLRYANNDGFDCVIIYNNEIIGQIGLHKIDKTNKSTSIGYWMVEYFQGHGIMTRACKALIEYCFYELKLEMIEVKCDIHNIRSRAIPERLQFKLVEKVVVVDPNCSLEKTCLIYIMYKTDWDSEKVNKDITSISN